MTEETVCVVLSTYNGASFVGAQLESIVAQEGVRIVLRVRDDGSRDGTAEAVRGFAERTPFPVHLEEGENVGPAASFLEGLCRAPAAPYYAFADQDDVWLPGKLRRAVALLAPLDGPAMSVCRLAYVDRELRPLGVSPDVRRPGLGNALVENIAVGCCVVMNRAARDLVVESPPGWVPMHDSWVYLVVSAFGRVVFDPEVGVLYRQHGGNVVGGEASLAADLIRRFRGLAGRPRVTAFRRQSREFLRVFGDRLVPDQQDLVAWHAAERHALWSRIREALRRRLYRNRPLDGMATKAFILLDRC